MEQLLHYIWQQKLFMARQQATTDGQTVEVIDVGRYNTDGGPDFFNAKIKIGTTLWVGNVEIHTCASDWKKHGHDSDKAYDNVILHVVKTADAVVCRTNGTAIPQCELQYPQPIEEKFSAWLQNKQRIACEAEINIVPDIFISEWKTSLLTERLEQKTEAINAILAQNKNFWEEAFYIRLARNFGFHTNGLPFEQLAKSLPLSYLGKHKDNLFQIEAMLFGQAGLLLGQTDEYALKLQQEYFFLQQKFALQPLDACIWKLLRLRPCNFPHVRIAQFAALIHTSSKLFSKILETETYAHLQQLFVVQTDSYWDTHFLFGESSKAQPKRLGKAAIDILLINTVIPFLFAYGKSKNNFMLQEKAVNLLAEIPAERNSIITQWKNLGMNIQNAFDSQAFLQLRQQYCDSKKCLQCRIGYKILQVTSK